MPSKKINFYINHFKNFFSGRQILIAKEITKIHEEYFRDEVDKLKVFKNPVKGELTVVISERNTNSKKFDKEKIVNKIKKYLEKYSVKDTVKFILEKENISKKKVYELCLELKNEKNN